VTTAPGGDLVVVGAGGFGRETVEAVRAMTSNGAAWRLLGYLDDDPSLTGTTIDGVPILAGIAEAANLPNASFVISTGRPDNYRSRLQIVERLNFAVDRYATIIHPAAAISTSSRIGPGSVLLACTVLTAAVQIGAHVVVMPHVTLTHDDIVEDFATLASGAAAGGRVRIGRCAYIGSGALIREGRTVGDYSLIGMGAVVTVDVPPRQVWTGVPARHLRNVDL
jgi:sugar O-acyltransferase (sialic acid O-acetyltransferase NeuD family)